MWRHNNSHPSGDRTQTTVGRRLELPSAVTDAYMLWLSNFTFSDWLERNIYTQTHEDICKIFKIFAAQVVWKNINRKTYKEIKINVTWIKTDSLKASWPEKQVVNKYIQDDRIYTMFENFQNSMSYCLGAHLSGIIIYKVIINTKLMIMVTFKEGIFKEALLEISVLSFTFYLTYILK